VRACDLKRRHGEPSPRIGLSPISPGVSRGGIPYIARGMVGVSLPPGYASAKAGPIGRGFDAFLGNQMGLSGKGHPLERNN
jgi:hypothetical protein